MENFKTLTLPSSYTNELITLKNFRNMRFLLFLLFSLLTVKLSAQLPALVVEGKAPDFYISHTVSPKENFYSIGRLYNQTPKSIEAFSKLSMAKGLAIDQVIKIPVNETNFEANNRVSPGQVLVPLYHVVEKNETLFSIASKYGVTVDNIKKWNKLTTDNLDIETEIIVGHLKTGGDQVTFLLNITPTKLATRSQKLPVNKPIDVVNKEVSTPQAKSEPLFDMPVKKQLPAEKLSETASQKSNAAGGYGEERHPTPIKSADNNVEKVDLLVSNTEPGIEGAFAPYYSSEALEKSETTKDGNAATFKTTSGWLDKKYYALMNNVTPGTILKITSSENKSVYVKVLGAMPDMRENNGILMRISNSAASYLGIMDPKFQVQVSYYQ
jgi:LysM repeat protein